jgi:hypothetical protein
LDDILQRGNAIAGDLVATTYNPTTSKTLKILKLKIVRWMQSLYHSALLNSGLGLFSIVGFAWLHHKTSLADVTMGTTACTLLKGKSDIKAVT